MMSRDSVWACHTHNAQCSSIAVSVLVSVITHCYLSLSVCPPSVCECPSQNWYHFLSLYLTLSWCDDEENASASIFIRSVFSSSSLSFSPRSRATYRQTDRQTDRHAYGHRHTVRDTAQHYISLHNYMHSCSEFQWSKLSQNHQNIPNWDSNSSKICSRVVDLFACYWPYIFTIAWLHYRSIRSDTHGAFWRSTISYNDNTWHFSLELSDKHTQP